MPSIGRTVKSFWTDEPEVLDKIVGDGYHHLNTGQGWYETDHPLTGFRQYGTRLSLLEPKEIEKKKLEDFMRRWTRANT